jgi:hypothetical protein
MVLWEGLGRRLEALAGGARDQVVLVAPFIKQAALLRLIEHLPASTPLLCVTRWRVEELACGVSDLDIWQDLSVRGNARLLLIRGLHAKYFRFDANVIVGSCNITGAALGFKQPSNLEIAVSLEANAQTVAFEACVASLAVPATQEMYNSLSRILESLPPTPVPALASDASPPDASPVLGSDPASLNWLHWLPTCRTPEALFDAYSGRLEDLTHATRGAALADLQQIEPPIGLNRYQFEAFVAGTVLSSPAIAKLAAFARTPRRFGEMRNLLRGLDLHGSAPADWQTVMRWLLHFAPDRFSMHTAQYSEIFEARW